MLPNEHLSRQIDIIPPASLTTPVTIIGAGAIGGWTALSLAKMGMTNLTVYDFDTVDIVNMNSQFYRFKDINRPKAEALADLIEDFTQIKIRAITGRYIGGQFDGIVISAVDSMAVRHLIWKEHQKALKTDLIIDPRMGAESALLYAMQPNNLADRRTYPKTLYSDEDAVQARCTAKATIYTANLLAGLVVRTVKGFLIDRDYPRTVQWDIRHDIFMCYHGGSHATKSDIQAPAGGNHPVSYPDLPPENWNLLLDQQNAGNV